MRSKVSKETYLHSAHMVLGRDAQSHLIRRYTRKVIWHIFPLAPVSVGFRV